ncbi:MAG: PAS domain S-box protein, partial [Methanoregula sp.]|nr:PAS domain S-box protein [Methanoregula sp.]
LLEIGKLFLESNNEFTVNTSPSATWALDHLKSRGYDAIVSDYQMPKMDGITFLKKLRESGNTTPFIIFTGRGREEVVIEALNSGADFYIQKGGEPTSQFAELAHKIRHAISRRRADLALEKSERDYRHLIEHANEAIYVVQDGYLRMVNPRSAEISGYSEQEMINQPLTLFVHPDDRGMLLDRFRRRINGEEIPSRYSFRLSRKDGTVRWVELSVVALTWDGCPATLNFLTDITKRKLAEDALRESEERYRQFFRTSLDSMFITTPDGQWIDFNDALVEMFGYKGRDEMFHVPVNSIYAYPGKREEFLTLVERDGYIKEYPVQLKKRGASLFDALITIVPQKNSDGSSRAFIGTVRDITDRTCTENALRESEERYHQFFRTTRDSVFITSPEGRFIDFNDALMETMGSQSREETFAVDVASCYADPEERARFLEQVKRDGFVKEHPLRFRRHDGSVFDALITIVPQKNPDGSVKAFIGTIRDITSHKRTEDALRQSEERYRHIFDTFDDLYYQTDMDGNLTVLSPSLNRVTGYTPEELIGRPVAMLYVNPGDRADLLGEIARNGFVRDYELLLRKRDGTHAPASLNANRIYDDAGTPAGVAGILRDVTRRKRAEEKLRESEEKFRSLVEYGLEAILILDLQGNVLFANRAANRTLEIDDKESLVGRNVMEVIPPESRADVMKDFEQVARGHDAFLARYHVITAKGRTIQVESIGKIITYEGRPADLISLRDIPERENRKPTK